MEGNSLRRNPRGGKGCGQSRVGLFSRQAAVGPILYTAMDYGEPSDLTFLEYNGRLVMVRTCPDAGDTKIVLSFFGYSTEEGKLVREKSFSKPFRGSWSLLGAGVVFCTNVGANRVCLVLRKMSPDGFPTNGIALLISDIVALNVYRFQCEFESGNCPAAAGVTLIDGPAFFVWDSTSQTMFYMCFTQCNLKQCGAPTFVTKQASNLQLGSGLVSVHFQHFKVTKYGRSCTFLMVERESTKTDSSVKQVHSVSLDVKERICPKCYASVPSDISLTQRTTNIIPSCYLSCISNLHCDSTQRHQSSVFIVTTIGQIVHCVGGDIKHVCTIPYVGFDTVSVFHTDQELVLLHDSIQQRSLVIDSETFKVVNAFDKVLAMVAGDFLRSGRNQLLFVKEGFVLNTDRTEVFKTISDIAPQTSDEAAAVVNVANEVESPIDLFCSMDVDKVKEEIVPNQAKSKLQSALHHSIIQQKIATQNLTDMIERKKLCLSDALAALDLSSSNYGKADSKRHKQPTVRLFGGCVDNQPKELRSDCEIEICDFFHRELDGKYFVCSLIKNQSLSDMNDIFLHISTFGETQSSVTSVNCILIARNEDQNVRGTSFDTTSQCAHPPYVLQSIIPGSEAWVVGSFATTERLLLENAHKVKQYSVKITWTSGSEPPVSHDVESFKLALSEVDTDSPVSLYDTNCFQIILNALNTYYIKLRIFSEVHSLRAIRVALEGHLNFVRFRDESDIFIYMHKGPLYLIRTLLSLESEVNGIMYVMCKNRRQAECLITSLEFKIPADIKIQKMDAA